MEAFQPDEKALLQQLEARALQLLAQREHASKELAYKLNQKFLPLFSDANMTEKLPGLVILTLEKCLENGWLSDERYVEAYVHQSMLKGHGPYKIRQNLQQRCDRDDLIDAHLALDDSDWVEMAKEVLIKKFGDSKKPAAQKDQAKRMRFLQSRGFSQSQIWKVFD